MSWNDELHVVLAVIYAMALGGAVGVERELKDRPAGFRTHMLVAGAAAFLIGTGSLVLKDAQDLGHGMLQMDPLRLIEAVIAGVAFIGAGTIFARRDTSAMVGITTAASLLMVATIGIAAGLGYEMLALIVTGLTLFVLGALRGIERWMNERISGASGAGSE